MSIPHHLAKVLFTLLALSPGGPMRWGLAKSGAAQPVIFALGEERPPYLARQKRSQASEITACFSIFYRTEKTLLQPLRKL